ncbi:MAG TPA: hypothetical protein GX692_04890 [Acholeplasmataceae bacterium]|nr:hypothetical protein [Acholeplasmataceae bacterium]
MGIDLGRSKKIIDKIRINQFMVKNKNCSPGQRRKAYLELKRLNFLKEPGNVLMMPDVNMAYMYSDHGQIHHYLVYRTDKKIILQ